MKRILSILSVSVLISLFPLTSINAQETKTEKKIKIIIDEGSGEKVIIDTIVNDNSDLETIKLVDGRIIIVSTEDHKDRTKDKEDSRLVTVTVSTDDETGKATKEVRIIGSDSAYISDNDGVEKIYVITSDSKGQSSSAQSNVKVWTEKGEGTDGEKVFVVKKVHSDDCNSEKSYDVFVTDDEKESSVEKTRYVVAKNGMVVTVEGEDEAKANELIKVIEDYLGVKNKGEEKDVKSESKKSNKK